MIKKLIEKIFKKKKEKKIVIPKKDFNKEILEPFFSNLNKQYTNQKLTIYDKNFTINVEKLIKEFKNIAIITNQNIDSHILRLEKKYGVLIDKIPYNSGIVINIDDEFITK